MPLLNYAKPYPWPQFNYPENPRQKQLLKVTSAMRALKAKLVKMENNKYIKKTQWMEILRLSKRQRKTSRSLRA